MATNFSMISKNCGQQIPKGVRIQKVRQKPKRSLTTYADSPQNGHVERQGKSDRL